MKGYPLIYSRTKNVDFVPDFLVRPKDLDCQVALRYVKDAMENLDFIQGIRYTAFSVGRYCVCGGIACISAKLVGHLKGSSISFLSRYPDVADYLKDCKGRNVACFIGIAIPKSEVKKGMLPDIPLEQYWEIYLEYLKHQWQREADTHSEQLDMPPLDIREKRYIARFAPTIEKHGTHNVVKDYSMHEQQTLDYFFNQIFTGSDDSLITEINDRSEWEKLNFKTAAVSDALYQMLKENPTRSNLLGSRDTEKRGNIEINRGPEYVPGDRQKKTGASSKGSLMLLIGGVVILVILLLILRR